MAQPHIIAASEMLFGDRPANAIILGVGQGTFDPLRFLQEHATHGEGRGRFPIMVTLWDLAVPHDLSSERLLPFIFGRRSLHEVRYETSLCSHGLMHACADRLQHELRERRGRMLTGIPMYGPRFVQVLPARKGDRIFTIHIGLVPMPGDRGLA